MQATAPVTGPDIKPAKPSAVATAVTSVATTAAKAAATTTGPAAQQATPHSVRQAQPPRSAAMALLPAQSTSKSRSLIHEGERAYVLHTYPYSETSLIVEMFTRASGRVPLVAKGVKRTRSQSAALMQFQPFNVSWSGRGDLRTLKKAEWQGGVPHLPAARLFCGFYLNELMLKLLARDDAHEDLFDCYENALTSLAGGEAEAGVLRGFEKAMLRETGYALALTVDAFNGNAVSEGARYTYIPGRGPRRLVSGEAPGLEISGRTLLDIERDDFSLPRTATEAKLLMRMLVQHQMNGRPLVTRQVFSQLLEL